MDDYMFNNIVDGCKYVPEATTYLEIFNYSVGVSAVLLPISILIQWNRMQASTL